jgi:hypothetical protein
MVEIDLIYSDFIKIQYELIDLKQEYCTSECNLEATNLISNISQILLSSTKKSKKNKQEFCSITKKKKKKEL